MRPLPKPDLCRESITHYGYLQNHPTQSLPSRSLPRHLQRRPTSHWISHALDCCEIRMPPHHQQKNSVRDKGLFGVTMSEISVHHGGKRPGGTEQPTSGRQETGVSVLTLFPPFNYNWVLRLRNGAPPYPLVNPVCLENPPRHAQKCAPLSSRHSQSSQEDNQDYHSHLPRGLTDGPRPGVRSALTGQPLVSPVGPQFRHFS